MAKLKLTEKLWVIFTIGLISFIAYTSQIFVIWPWYDRELSWELVALLGPFNVLVGMIFWSYYLCVTTEPGRVPDKWEPDPGREDMEVKKLTGGPRYCSKCSAYKPPRAHHCKTCNRCILRMDHHCPWTANCIGHHNYASFVRFLTFVDVSCTYNMVLVCSRIWDFAKGGENTYLNEPSGREIIFVVLNLAACIPVLLSVGIFSLYHYWSLWSNTTTIEAWEKDKVATLIRRGKIRDIKYPYNISPYKNISSILGYSPLYWCWPAQKVPGDGLRFAIAAGSDVYTSLCWPPYDPNYLPHSRRPVNPNLPTSSTSSSSAFTYGHDAPNPRLQPSNAEMRRRGGSKNPPWGPQSQGGTSWSGDEDSLSESEDDDVEFTGSEEDDEEELDEDDVPLGMKVKVRRGSEGVEVRHGSWGGGGGAEASGGGGGGGGGWEVREREEAVRRFEERRRRAGM
ncbi:DHHC palmitoyltransferase-domain-containing protein [Mrakia frigida]|uniref:palmitoyltransferase PFA4 n=1 Tax=Mrakia frigida TaxID=29902 RepID=UPI003FCBFE6D